MEAMCLQAAWMCVMSTTRSTSTFDPSVPRNAVMVTTSSASARGITFKLTGARVKVGGGDGGGNAGGSGAGGGGFVLAIVGAVLRLFLGVVNQLDDGDERIECKGCWKNDGAGITGAGGFRSDASTRATMLGAGADLTGGMVPLLRVGDGGIWGLLGASLSRVHRDTSSGRKQMQNRKK